jgi:acyl-CoA synthetase (NDP forming)
VINAMAVQRLLRPKSVAIVGASATPGSLGASVQANLRRLAYGGDVHLINPNRSAIDGHPCLRSIEELPGSVDVAVLAIPRPGVLPAIHALAARGVGAAVIFSAGFAEGGDSGRAEQVELAHLAKEHGMLIEGPNCLGFVNNVDGVALTFVETAPAPLAERPGIGIVSQSGAMACVLGTMLGARNLGISYSISTGNEAASGAEDFLDYLLADPNTRAIGMIVEQFRQPERFLSLAKRARTLGKDIVLLHPGRSSAARQSAATHTGALAGDYPLMCAKVAGEGVIQVDSLEQLGDVLEIVTRSSCRSQRGAVLMTESGAFKALALDLSEEVGLLLPNLDDLNAPALRAAMPQFVPVSNPLDLTAQGLVDPDIFRRTLLALCDDERVGAIILAIIQTDVATCDRKFPAILDALNSVDHSKLIVFAGLDEGAQVPSQYLEALRARGVSYFPSPERAIRALARLNRATGQAAISVQPIESGNLHLPSGIIPEYRAKEILGQLGFPFPAGRFVRTLEEALLAVQNLGYPVALKAQSADLSHKSDAGGVVLGLRDSASLEEGWHTLHENIAHARPGMQLDGILMETMGKPGCELIIGGRNDPDWGPVVLAGFGGIQAELLHDVQLILPGEDEQQIISKLRRLRAGALLSGYRGSPALDTPVLAKTIKRLAALLSANRSIKEIDLNPVIAYPLGQGVIALDALIVMG